MNKTNDTVMYATFQGGEQKPITNFEAWIVEEESKVTPAGDFVERTLLIEGRIGDKPLPRIRVDWQELSGISWPEKHWGISSGVEIYLPNTAGQKLKSAIKRASQNIASVKLLLGMGFNDRLGGTAYTTHTGSICIDRQDNKFRSALKSPMSYYEAGRPTKDSNRLRQAFRLLLKVLDVSGVNSELGTLLVALMFRPVLSIFIRTDYIVWLVGFSGALKTSTAALVLNGYGKKFDEDTMPANWIDNLAALEDKISYIRHAPLCIDDYLEEGSIAHKYIEKAVQLIRMVGDGVLKGKKDGSGFDRLSNAEPLTVLPFTTAELMPRNLEESSYNRCVICPVLEGEIQSATLFRLQKYGRAGAYAQVIANFIQYVLEYRDDLERVLKEIYEEERVAFRGALDRYAHGRQPDNFASLMLGIHGMLLFVKHFDLLDQDEIDAIELRCRGELIKLAIKQSQLQESTQLGEILTQRLQGALLQGKCYLLMARTGRKPTSDLESRLGWRNGKPQGLYLGWIDIDRGFLYLRIDKGDAVLQFVRGLDKRLVERKEGIGTTTNRCGRFLAEQSLLRGRENGRGTNLVRKTFPGRAGVEDKVFVIKFPLD